MPETVVLAGALAQRPGIGGHAWVFLQYLLGFRQLGWDVVFVDRLDEEMCEDDHGRRCSVEQSRNLAYLVGVLRRFGLEDTFALLTPGGETIGMRRADLLRRTAEAAALLNVMGYLDDEELLEQARLRVFLDIDPGFPQMWRELGLHDAFNGHDAFVSVGESIGEPGCDIPTCGLQWIATRPPVALAQWPVDESPGQAFTTIASWRGAFGPIERGGRRYGLRAHEFRRFFSLPRLTGQDFELALDIHPDEEGDLRKLHEEGWRLVHPEKVAGDPDDYRSYIARSRGELMVAKNMYVDTRSGWFSDRSACYLASGRPVLAQDTGFSDHLPTSEGLVAFSTLEDAVSGAEEIARNGARHRRAARELAEQHFDSRRVLGRLLADLRLA